MDVREFEDYRPFAIKHGLSLEALVLGCRLAGAVKRRELPILGYADEQPHWLELRVAMGKWGKTAAAQTYAESVQALWAQADEELTPELRRIAGAAKPADVVRARGTFPRLLRAHLLMNPPLLFPETHGLLFFVWNLAEEEPLRPALRYYCEALWGQVLNEAMTKALLADDVVGGLVLYADGTPRGRAEGLEMIIPALLGTHLPKPRVIGAEDWEDERRHVAHDYLVKELPKVEGLELDELLERAFRGQIASRHGYRMDVLNLIGSARIRRAKQVADVETEDELSARFLDHGGQYRGVAHSLADLTYREIGERLDAQAERIKALSIEIPESGIRRQLGESGLAVLRAHLDEPGIRDKEIAERLGSSLSTVERANRVIRENAAVLLTLLGLRDAAP